MQKSVFRKAVTFRKAATLRKAVTFRKAVTSVEVQCAVMQTFYCEGSRRRCC